MTASPARRARMVVSGVERAHSGSGGEAEAISDRDLLAFAQGELSEQERLRIELQLDANPEEAEVLAEFARIFGSSGVADEDDEPESADEGERAEGGATPGPRFSPVAGSRLGRYLLIGELGRGGMSVVYRAYDPKLQREVALKCLGPQRMSTETQARLVREAQAMAKLNHRNVVSVYDVDLLDERFVLAMEYVEGMNLGRWVRVERRAWPDVLSVFIEAGRGLTAAHAAGLLHRDFKPANVLISAEGEVKVTDFGIARVEESPGEARPAELLPVRVELDDVVYRGTGPLTEDGEVVGTPAYMPPEQFQGRVLTAAADQYAFCVSLWEALTGTLPFGTPPSDGRNITALIQLKVSGPPRWPSSASGVPRGIVDAITRGLSVDPDARWPSMDALLDRLRIDPTRRRRTLLLGGVVAVALAGAVGWSAYRRSSIAEACEREGRSIEAVWSDDRAQALTEAFERSPVVYASGTWSRARPRVDDFVHGWVEARTAVCRAGELEGSLSPRRLELSRACLDEQQAMLASLVEQWSSLDDTVVRRASSAAWSLAQPRACTDPAELDRGGERREQPGARDEVQRIREQAAEVRALVQTGRYAEAQPRAEALLQEALALQVPRVAASVRRELGEVQLSLGRYDAAVEAFEAAYQESYAAGDDMGAMEAANALAFVVGDRLARYDEARRWAWLARLGQQRLGLPEDHPAVAASLNNLGVIHLASGEYAEALAAYQQALALREATLGPDHPEVATILGNIGGVYVQQGAYQRALAPYERALAIRSATQGPEHPDVAMALNNLGNVYLAQGRYEESLAVHERALAIREASLPADHPHLAVTLANVGATQNELGHHEAALAAQRRALDILERTLGPEHPDVGAALDNVGNTYESMGDYEAARRSHERALAIAEVAHGPEHPTYAMSLNNLGIVYKELGLVERALEAHRRALEIWTRALEPDHPYIATARLNMGTVLHDQGRYAQALAAHQAALTSWERSLEPDHPYVAIARFNVGLELLELGRPEEALVPIRQALDVFSSSTVPPPELGEVRYALARATWAQGDRAEGLAQAQGALDDLLRLAPQRTELIDEVRAWVKERSGASRSGPPSGTPTP